jgi:hypothetical protein
MKKFFAIIAIASVVMVSCNDSATTTKTEGDSVKPVENVTPATPDSVKVAMPDSVKVAVPATDSTKK